MGRPIPTESNPKPNVYRMRIFAKDEVCAKSRFYYFVSKLKRLKKAHGEILSVTKVFFSSQKIIKHFFFFILQKTYFPNTTCKVFERKTNRVKNYSIFLRYNSRSGTHNMNKEYRDVSAVGAVNQLCMLNPISFRKVYIFTMTKNAIRLFLYYV